MAKHLSASRSPHADAPCSLDTHPHFNALSRTILPTLPRDAQPHADALFPGEPGMIHPGKRRRNLLLETPRTPVRLFTASSQSRTLTNATKGFAPSRVTNRCQERPLRRRGRAQGIWFTNSKDENGDPKDGNGNSFSWGENSKDGNGDPMNRCENSRGRGKDLANGNPKDESGSSKGRGRKGTQ